MSTMACSTEPAKRDEAVVQQDSDALVADAPGEPVCLLARVHHAVVLGDERMLPVERARRLIDHLDGDAQRRERGPPRRMRVADGHGIRTLLVKGGVDRERRLIVGTFTLEDPTLVVDDEQVVGGDLFEEESERVDPELVVGPRHAAADVAGDAVIHLAPRDDAERGREVALQGDARRGVSVH